MEFSSLKRAETYHKMENEELDLLVIGGGITGAGIALDAATRGMKVAVVEMQDFAAGTSSRSTKLVHGGLRYLKQFEVKMVADVGKERAIVYENGPHVTTPEWMLLPLHKGGTFGPFSTSIGLRVYDFLAGVKKSERRKMLSSEETLEKEPLVKKDGLKGGGYYVEYRTDDARLTIEVLKKAVEMGTTAINYAKAENLVYENGRLSGVTAIDQLSGKNVEIHAKNVVNAAGPWVDTIREKDGSKNGKSLILSKGVHVVIDQSRFPLRQAIYFDSPDGRMIFAIPRAGKAYVGTTDTFYKGDIAHPSITKSDRAYLIKAINYMFPDAKIVEGDIESSWAGVRPLIHEEGKGPSEISRKDEIWESESGLITIAGGKLTGYRKMAEIVVDFVAKKIGEIDQRSFPPCRTKKMPISGGDVGGSKNFLTFAESMVKPGTEHGLMEDDAYKLACMYGSNVAGIFSLIKAKKAEADESMLPLPLFAMLAYGIESEMVATPLDFYFRRTGDLLFDIDSVRKWKDQVGNYMAERFEWTEEQKGMYMEELNRALDEAAHPADD